MTTHAPSWFETAFEGQRVMVILRGRPPAQTVELCHRAWDLGITQVEVPVQSSDAVPSLRAAVAAGAERGHGVGAGTVTTVEQLIEVAGIGVSFTVAPGLDDDIVRWSQDHGLPHLPGVSTPSEIQRAVRHGLDWVKAFPANVLGDSWFAAMRGPFPRLRTVATGGMSVTSVEPYQAAGARIVSLGSALEDPAQLEELGRLLG